MVALALNINRDFGNSMVPNLRVLGETIKKLKWPRGGIDGLKGYYLRLKS